MWSFSYTPVSGLDRCAFDARDMPSSGRSTRPVVCVQLTAAQAASSWQPGDKVLTYANITFTSWGRSVYLKDINRRLVFTRDSPHVGFGLTAAEVPGYGEVEGDMRFVVIINFQTVTTSWQTSSLHLEAEHGRVLGGQLLLLNALSVFGLEQEMMADPGAFWDCWTGARKDDAYACNACMSGDCKRRSSPSTGRYVGLLAPSVTAVFRPSESGVCSGGGGFASDEEEGVGVLTAAADPLHRSTYTWLGVYTTNDPAEMLLAVLLQRLMDCDDVELGGAVRQLPSVLANLTTEIRNAAGERARLSRRDLRETNSSRFFARLNINRFPHLRDCPPRRATPTPRDEQAAIRELLRPGQPGRRLWHEVMTLLWALRAAPLPQLSRCLCWAADGTPPPGASCSGTYADAVSSRAIARASLAWISELLLSGDRSSESVDAEAAQFIGRLDTRAGGWLADPEGGALHGACPLVPWSGGNQRRIWAAWVRVAFRCWDAVFAAAVCWSVLHLAQWIHGQSGHRLLAVEGEPVSGVAAELRAIAARAGSALAAWRGNARAAWSSRNRPAPAEPRTAAVAAAAPEAAAAQVLAERAASALAARPGPGGAASQPQARRRRAGREGRAGGSGGGPTARRRASVDLEGHSRAGSPPVSRSASASDPRVRAPLLQPQPLPQPASQPPPQPLPQPEARSAPARELWRPRCQRLLDTWRALHRRLPYRVSLQWPVRLDPWPAPEPNHPIEVPSGPPVQAEFEQPARAFDDDEDADVCLVCMENPRRFGFMHGNSVHKAVCEECAQALRRRPGQLECVLCRKRVERVLECFG